MTEEQLEEMRAKIEADKAQLLAKKDMEEGEKNKLKADLENQEKELEGAQ